MRTTKARTHTHTQSATRCLHQFGFCCFLFAVSIWWSIGHIWNWTRHPISNDSIFACLWIQMTAHWFNNLPLSTWLHARCVFVCACVRCCSFTFVYISLQANIRHQFHLIPFHFIQFNLIQIFSLAHELITEYGDFDFVISSFHLLFFPLCVCVLLHTFLFHESNHFPRSINSIESSHNRIQAYARSSYTVKTTGTYGTQSKRTEKLNEEEALHWQCRMSHR